MGTILEILTTNYDGQYADITFYPCSGGSINIGGVILPYNYQTEYYYGTYDIYLPNYDKTCSLNVPCLTPTVTPTPTQTPTPSITPTNTVTPTITPTNTVTPTITPTITPTVTPTPSPLPPTIEYFKECCFGNITYKVGGVTTPITVGNTYYITTDEFTFCGIASNEEPYDNQSLVVTVSSYTNCVLCITDNPCPSPTPTNTPTMTVTPTNTSTPTPTPTQTPCVPQTIYSGENFINLYNQFCTSFKSDGTILYISRHNNGTGGGALDRIAGYFLSTPWDVSTISSSVPNVTGNLSINQSGSTVASGHHFSPDGTNLFVCGYNSSTTNFVIKYNLSTSWDITTQSFTSGDTYSIGNYLDSYTTIDFSVDGLFMFIQKGTLLRRYTLTTPWDISSGVTETQSITTPNTLDISFQNGGNYLFSLVSSVVQKQTLSSPYDLSTITSTETVDLTGVIPLGNFPSINFKDGYKFFVSKYGAYNDLNPNSRNNIYALNLTCEFDISGPTIVIP